MLHEIMTPGFLPDISALNVQMQGTYDGKFITGMYYQIGEAG
jgi:hypothetical protein